MFVMAAGVAMILAVTGCGDGRKVPENSLAFEDVVYVEDGYPVTWELAQGDTLDLPVLGVSDFVIKDSLLIVSNNDNAGRVTVLSVDGRTVYGKFLRMGRGPGEIVSFNGVSSVQFSYKEDGHLTACWTDYAGNLMEWDVTASIENGRTELASRSLELQDSPWLLSAVPLDGQEYLIVHAGADRSSINRFILSSDGERRTTPPLDRLNSAAVKAEPESGSGSVVGSGNMVSFSVPGFNLIYGSYAYDSSRGLIVEAERTLNTMNIFSADGTYARTVCTYGDRVDDISSVEYDSDARLPGLYLCPALVPGTRGQAIRPPVQLRRRTACRNTSAERRHFLRYGHFRRMPLCSDFRSGIPHKVRCLRPHRGHYSITGTVTN